MDSAIDAIESCPWGFLGVVGTVVLLVVIIQQTVEETISASGAFGGGGVGVGGVDGLATAAPAVPLPGRPSLLLLELLLSLAGLVVVVTASILDTGGGGWCGWMHRAGALAPCFFLSLLWTLSRRTSSRFWQALTVIFVAQVGRCITAAAAAGSLTITPLDVAAVSLLTLLLLAKVCTAFFIRQRRRRRITKGRRRKQRRIAHTPAATTGNIIELEEPLLATSDDEEDEDEDGLDDASPAAASLDRANLFSRLGFCWMNPLLRIGFKRQLSFDDIPPLSEGDTTTFWATRFKAALTTEKLRPRPSLLHVAHVVFGAEYYCFAGLQLLNDLLAFSGPVLLKLVVTFVQEYASGTTTLNHGYTIFAVLLGCYIAGALLSTQYNLRMSRVQLHVRTALVSAIYGQVLECRAAQLGVSGAKGTKEGEGGGGGVGTGEVTNLMTVDVQRVQDAASSFNQFWSLPLQVGLTLFLLYREVSYAFIAGLAVIALMIPINTYIAQAITRVSQKQMSIKDQRVQACDELIHGIRAIKALTWEDHLASLLARLRGQEVSYLAQRKYLDAFCVYFWAATPVLTSLATFVAVVQIEHTITPAAVFTTISLLNMLIYPMNAFPWVVNGLMEARVSKKRLERFLLRVEVVREYVVYVGGGEKGEKEEGEGEGNGERRVMLEVQGSFAWDRQVFKEEEGEKKTEGKTRSSFVPAVLPEREVNLEELEEGVGLLSSSSSSSSTTTTTTTNTTDTDTHTQIATPTKADHTPLSFTPFQLRDLHLRIHQGEIVGIYGQIGAGKSTLLSAILGETYASPGSYVRVCVFPSTSTSTSSTPPSLPPCGGHGRRAYVTQTPWLQRGSIQDNIVFTTHKWDPARFEAVVRVCGLASDLAAMPDGAQTEVGERGGTLSGGQRLRVALARALYARAEVYLLDDPFSGLDGRTARHVAKEAIYGMMRREGATVVMVTHALPLLDGCDWAVAMRGGRVVERVRFGKGGRGKGKETGEREQQEEEQEEKVKKEKDPAAAVALEDDNITHTHTQAQAQPQTETTTTPTVVAQEETREEGHVKWQVHKYYLQATGTFLTLTLLLCLLGMQLSANAFNYWLSIWSTNTDTYTPHDFLLISGTIAGINSFFTFLRAFLFAYGGLKAARQLHDKLLSAVLAAALSFFEANPVGRILNRFAQDTYTIDDSLPFILNIFLAQGVGLLGTVIVLLIASPSSVLVLLIVAVIYHRLQTYYRATSRELKRLDSVSRSPIFAHFSETMSGAPTIRAFDATEAFLANSLVLVDGNQRVSFYSNGASQWLALRLQGFGVLVVASVAAWAVISCATKHPASPGLLGLSLSYALPVVGNLSGLLSSYTETEKEMVAVERVHEFTTQPPEVDVVGGEEEEEGGGGTVCVVGEVPSEWPSRGEIVIQDLTLRYRPRWPPALDQINATIKPGEKLGICGRTGSGKTSLLAALFRLVSWQEGGIFIDGLPIQKVPLKRLRSSLVIIPQEPTLFAGTLRSNLDPAGEYADGELYRALEACHLPGLLLGGGGCGGGSSENNTQGSSTSKSERKGKGSRSNGGGDGGRRKMSLPSSWTSNKKGATASSSSASSLSQCLSLEVKEKGLNFSVGQRQLICLCRVLLKKAQIVCVDEATASLDLATDALVRHTITKAFKHATVITIAHRLSTVLELCTRVLVLSAGRVVEEGEPLVLMKDGRSQLARLGAEEERGHEGGGGGRGGGGGDSVMVEGEVEM